jgi:hypothetical protein
MGSLGLMSRAPLNKHAQSLIKFYALIMRTTDWLCAWTESVLIEFAFTVPGADGATWVQSQFRADWVALIQGPDMWGLKRSALPQTPHFSGIRVSCPMPDYWENRRRTALA